MSLIFPFYGGWFFCKSTFVDLNSETTFIHNTTRCTSNFRVAFVGSFPTKKCGDGNRCSVGVLGEEGCCFLSQMDDKL